MCFTYDEIASNLWQDTHKARKPRRCCECRCWIWPGETYLCSRGVWGGEFNSYSQCERCVRLICAVGKIESDHGCPSHESIPPFGCLHEDLYEYRRELDGLVPAHLIPSPDVDDLFDSLADEYGWSAEDELPVEEHGDPVG